MSIHRREWLTAMGAVGLGAAFPVRTEAIEPITRSKGATMRLSLAAYSFNRQLSGRAEPRMTLEEFIDYSATLPLDAVELTSYYFLKESKGYIAEKKLRATRLGLDVSGTAVRNDFCLADPEKLQVQIDHVKRWIEHASLMGAKAIRIFAGNVPKGESEDVVVQRCARAIEQTCEYAGEYGIYLALENHGGITAEADTMLKIVKAVDSPYFGVNLDTGNFRTADPYGDVQKLAPYAVNVQVKTEMAPKGGPKEEADLGRLIDMLREVGYRGYVVLEYEASEDPYKAVPRYVAELRKLLA